MLGLAHYGAEYYTCILPGIRSRSRGGTRREPPRPARRGEENTRDLHNTGFHINNNNNFTYLSHIPTGKCQHKTEIASRSFKIRRAK